MSPSDPTGASIGDDPNGLPYLPISDTHTAHRPHGRNGERLIAANDERQYFHGAYLRSTKAVMSDAASGKFIDRDWAERWGLASARLYMDAFAASEDGAVTSRAMADRFRYLADPDTPPMRHALLGINAHTTTTCPRPSSPRSRTPNRTTMK